MNISKDSYKALKHFYKKHSLTDKEIAKIPDDAFTLLGKEEYIVRDFCGYPDGRHAKYTDYHITELGKAYIQEHSAAEWFRQNWIGLFSLIFALIAAIPVILQVIEYILKHTM